jgi:hypothetical protein
MSAPRDLRKLAIVLAACTAGTLIAMVITSIVTGATQETHEHYKPPAAYAIDLLAHPAGTRIVFALDIAFLVLYTGFFGALTKYLHALGRPFARLAFGAMLIVTFLDILEDHHILGLLAVAEHGRPIDDSSILFQEVLSSTKFSVSYLALVLYGIAVPRTTLLGWALSLFLSVGTLFTAVLGYGAPPAWRESLDHGRWLGFLAGFALAFLWLRRAPDATSNSPAGFAAGDHGA